MGSMARRSTRIGMCRKNPKSATATPRSSKVHSRAMPKVVVSRWTSDPFSSIWGRKRRMGMKTTDAPRATVRMSAVLEGFVD